MLHWNAIPGWSQDIEPLYDHVARTCGPEAVLVEVGCWVGRSVAMLGQLLKQYDKPLVTIYAVDKWADSASLTKEMSDFARSTSLLAQFQKNIKAAGVDDLVKVIQSDSASAAGRFVPGSLDFVFLDADHRYQGIKADIAAWYPTVSPRGVLAGHDFTDPDVRRAVTEALPGAAGQGMVWVKVKE
jgi:predicted O-methyltransferase YrrM